MSTVARENEKGNIVAGKDVKGIQDVLDVLVPDDVQEEAHGDEVVVILTRTVNSEVPLSALAVEEQDDAGGGFDGKSAYDLDLHVKNWDNHGDEADDQRP